MSFSMFYDPFDSDYRSFYSPWEELLTMQKQLNRLHRYQQQQQQQQQIRNSDQTQQQQIEQSGKETKPGEKPEQSSSSSTSEQQQLSINEAPSQRIEIWRPSCDISETENSYMIRCELPGIPKENINIDLSNHSLNIQAESSQEKKDENEKFRRIERRFGRFQRSFPLNYHVDPTSIKTSFKDGVLVVEVPKGKSEVHKIALN